MRDLNFLSDTKSQAALFKQLERQGDELVPLSAGPEFGFTYSQLNRWVEGGRLKAYVLFGARYAKRSDVEDLEAPPVGRPKGSSNLRPPTKSKKLTDEQLGNVI